MALRVLQLNDWRVKSALQHEALKGKKRIARGVFSAIYEGSKPNTVFKVSVDSFGYWMLNCFVAGVTHRHFPRIVKDYGEIGHTSVDKHDFSIFLVEMEKLEKLKVGSDTKRLASLIAKQQVRSTMKCVSCHTLNSDKGSTSTVDALADIIKSKNAIPRSVRNALKQLENFCQYYEGSRLDMHLGNFMQRANGELVITDPLMDVSAYDARISQHCR